MANKKNKNRKPPKDRAQEEYVTNKILSIFVFSALLLMLLIITYRGYSHMNTYLVSFYGSCVAAGAAALGAIVAGVFAWWDKKKGIVRQYKVMTPLTICLACVLICVLGLVSIRFNVQGIKVLYAGVPAVAVLALIPMIYPRDFFFIALVTGCGILLMYIYSKEISELMLWQRDFSLLSLSATVISLALLAAWTVLLVRLRRDKGMLILGKTELEFYPKSTRYFFSFLTAGVVALCTLIAYLFGSVAAYYMIFLLLAYLFAMAVVYTVKML